MTYESLNDSSSRDLLFEPDSSASSMNLFLICRVLWVFIFYCFFNLLSLILRLVIPKSESESFSAKVCDFDFDNIFEGSKWYSESELSLNSNLRFSA